MLEKFMDLARFDPRLEAAWPTLVGWSEEKQKRSYPTWGMLLVRVLRQAKAHEEDAQARRSMGTNRLAQTDLGQEISTTFVSVDSDSARTRRFANCGQTWAAILEGLEAVLPDLKDLKRKPHTQTFSSHNREQLRALLSHVPAQGRILLLDFTFPGIHTFLVEIHPDGRRYLVQSYQAYYTAGWWKGAEDDEKGLALTRPGDHDQKAQTKYRTDHERLRQMRQRYGLGLPIADPMMDEFIGKLIEALASGAFATFAACWLELPFCPTSGEYDIIAKLNFAPALGVTTYDVANPQHHATTSICWAVVPSMQ